MFKSPIKSPVADKVAGAGLPWIAVEMKMVAIALASIVDATISDAVAIAETFIDFARMFQEFTIDAAKTCLCILIAYADDIRTKIKLFSRAFTMEVLMDFHEPKTDKDGNKINPVSVEMQRNGKVANQKEGWGNFGKKKMYFVKDEFFILSEYAAEIVKSLAENLLKIRPKFSDALINHIEAKKADEVFAACCAQARFVKDNIYHNVGEAQTLDIKAAYADIGTSNQKELDEKIREIKAEYREIIEIISNDLRVSFDSIGRYCKKQIPVEWMSMACLDASFRNSDGQLHADEADVSTFADNIAAEEFAMFMPNMLKKKGFEAIKYAEEELLECSFAEGDEAEFVFGEALAADGRKAVTKHDCTLTGTFLIGKNSKGYWVAKKLIRDALIRPEIDRSKTVVVTKAVPAGTSGINGLIEASRKHEVSMVQYRKVNGQEVREAIVCDGIAYEKYRRYVYSGKNAQLKSCFNSIGSGITGLLTKAIPMSYQAKDEKGLRKEMEYAILVFEDVHPTKNYVVIRNVAANVPEVIDEKEEEFIITGEDW